MELRVLKRYVWDSDERGYYVYILQELAGDGEWADVPVINEESGQLDDYD